MAYYLIGPYPPPLGGVSVFIYRFSKLLKAQQNKVLIVDFEKKNKVVKLIWLFFFSINPKEVVFDLNVSDFYSMFALLLRPFSGKIIFRDHSGRYIENSNKVQRYIVKMFLKKVDECIFVGEHITNYYIDQGITLSENLRIQNAFIPPPLEDEPEIWTKYTPDTLTFIKNRRPLIIANAYQIIFYKGVDLYGLDMCVELVAKLNQEYPDVGLLFALAEIGDNKYYQEINLRLEMKKIRDQFHFLVGQKELWPLFRHADVMVRPTYSDGYGISVNEALYFGCPAIASDVCKRPKGTILFHNRDIQSLLEKTKEVLQKNNPIRKSERDYGK